MTAACYTLPPLRPDLHSVPPIIIAIDGPSGAGKGTVARALASVLGYHHLDTGAMYRAVAWKALQQELPLDDEEAVGDLARRAEIDALDGKVTIDGADDGWSGRPIAAAVLGGLAFVAFLVIERRTDHPMVPLSMFANRTTYAGGIFYLYRPDGSLNRPQLEAWLRNPPQEKAMAPNDDDPTLSRGMPNLNLSEAAIDDLVEFLITLGPKPSDAIIQATEVE